MTLYLTNIARVYENMREWQKAMEFHLRVIDVAIAGGGGARSLEVSVALEDIAYCYIEKGLGMDHDQIVIRGSLNFLLRSFDISFSMYVLYFRPRLSILSSFSHFILVNTPSTFYPLFPLFTHPKTFCLQIRPRSRRDCSPSRGCGQNAPAAL